MCVVYQYGGHVHQLEIMAIKLNKILFMLKLKNIFEIKYVIHKYQPLARKKQVSGNRL